MTALRTNAAITADIARAIVGHDSEDIERQYCTASRADKMRGLDIIAQAISEPVASSATPYPACTARYVAGVLKMMGKEVFLSYI